MFSIQVSLLTNQQSYVIMRKYWGTKDCVLWHMFGFYFDMYVRTYVHVFIYLPIYRPIFLYLSMSFYIYQPVPLSLFIHPCIYLSTCLPTSLSIYISIHFPIMLAQLTEPYHMSGGRFKNSTEAGGRAAMKPSYMGVDLTISLVKIPAAAESIQNGAQGSRQRRSFPLVPLLPLGLVASPRSLGQARSLLYKGIGISFMVHVQGESF